MNFRSRPTAHAQPIRRPDRHLGPTRLGLSLVALALCAHGPDAFAYLDPGTGSILVQGLLALLATVGAFFGTIRRYVRQWMATRFSRSPNAATDDTTPDP